MQWTSRPTMQQEATRAARPAAAAPTVNARAKLLEKLSTLSPSAYTRLGAEERRLIEQVLRDEEQRRREFPLSAFEPHEKQRAFLEGRARLRLMLGGNRSGKTYVGCAEALSWALGYHPWLVPRLRLVGDPPVPPRREAAPAEAWVRGADGEPVPVPNRGIVVSGQGWGRGVRETVWPTVQALWGAASPIKTRLGPMGAPCEAVLPNGSVISFGAGTQERLAFEGATYQWAWIDEPVGPHVFSGIWRGLAQHRGSLFMTLTPLGEDARWLYTAVVSGTTPAEIYTAALADNPYIDPVAREEFERQDVWTEEERAARLYGRFECLGAAVHPEFSRERHVVEPFPIPEEWPKIMGCDPHLSRPWYFLWVALAPDGTKYCYREWPQDFDFFRARAGTRGIAEYAELVRALEGKERIAVRVIDPQMAQERLVTFDGFTKIREELAKAGLAFSTDVENAVALGMQRVRRGLLVGREGRSEIKVFRGLRHLITSLEQLSYQKETESGAERISRGYRDPWDVLRYVLSAADKLHFGCEVVSYLTPEQLRSMEEVW